MTQTDVAAMDEADGDADSMSAAELTVARAMAAAEEYRQKRLSESSSSASESPDWRPTSRGRFTASRREMWGPGTPRT